MLPGSDGGAASLFFKLGKGLFKTAEFTSTALEAACLGVSIAELSFECGSVHQSKCSELQLQGKKMKALVKESDSMFDHKVVVERMVQLNKDNLGRIDIVNNLILEVAKDGLRNIKVEGVGIVTTRHVRDLREQILDPAGSQTIDAFASVTQLKVNMTKYAENYQDRSSTEEERMAKEIKFSAIMFAVTSAFSLGPKIVPFILQTYNLHNVDLLVLDSEFSHADGGLSKFKQAVDTRSGNTYVLQYINIDGKDVIKNAIKFNPWDNSQLDLLHNYGLSATERAQAVDYLKKHPYTGPSTLQTVFEDPEFKDKLKHAADMQSVFEEIRKRRPEDPQITKTDIENADLNQLVDSQNSIREAHRITSDGPNVGKTKDDLTRFQKMKNWWKSISTGDPNYGKKAVVLMFEYPELADTLKKTKAFDTVMNQIASKEDDIDTARKFLDQLQYEANANEMNKIKKAAEQNGIGLSKNDIKKIIAEENHMKQFLREHPDVKEDVLRKIIKVVKNGSPKPIDTNNIYYQQYKESWNLNKEILNGQQKNLKNNINSNDAKDYFMKAINRLPTPEKVRDFISDLGNDATKVSSKEMKKILKENGIKDVPSSKIFAFVDTYNSDDKGLFSKGDHGNEAYFQRMIKEHLGLNVDQSTRVLDGIKEAKSVTPEKLKKIAKKKKFNLKLDPQIFEKSGSKYVPLDTKFAGWLQKGKHWWQSTLSSSNSDDLRRGWANVKDSFSHHKLRTSFEMFTGFVGVASTGLSFYTCAYQQLGSLLGKEKKFDKQIQEGKEKMKEFEENLIRVKSDIVGLKKKMVDTHCGLSSKYVGFINEITGNADKPVKPCSSVTLQDKNLVGRNLTYTAIRECYGKYKDDNPYRGTECKDIDEKFSEETSISEKLLLDYGDYQEFLKERLMNMGTFLQKQKDIILSTLNGLVLRYNVQSLSGSSSSIEQITDLLKKFQYTEGQDFTTFTILKMISEDHPELDHYDGYPLTCIKNNAIRNNEDLETWKNSHMNFDAEKLRDFTDAVLDKETLKYMRKKAAKGRYHFSTSTMSTEEANKRILREIASRVLTRAATYTDEDEEEYNLNDYRNQGENC